MSKNIGQIDKNLSVETQLQLSDVRFYDARKAPFRIYGLVDPGLVPFRRLPKELADTVNEQVSLLSTNTAGVRVRFRTDSEYVAIKAIMPTITHFPHMPFTGSSGFDLYLYKDGIQTYYKSFVPPMEMTDGYESVVHFMNNDVKDIVINFPLYNDLTDLYIGLQEAAQLAQGTEYKYTKPFIYYGSSITQGGCASRPGNCYQSIISRRFDADYLNFGYSAGARGEEHFMEYLAKLDASIFVMDYDHNAPTLEHLKQTHARALRIIRSYQPELPVILISKPDISLASHEEILRRDVIYTTYIEARDRGDRNVYFIDGYSLFSGEDRDSCTVDSCHPNDLGFWRMASVISNTISHILSQN